MNTDQIKKGFLILILGDQVQFHSKWGQSIEYIFFNLFLLFCYQKVGSNTKQETTCGMYRNDLFSV